MSGKEERTAKASEKNEEDTSEKRKKQKGWLIFCGCL